MREATTEPPQPYAGPRVRITLAVAMEALAFWIFFLAVPSGVPFNEPLLTLLVMLAILALAIVGSPALLGVRRRPALPGPVELLLRMLVALVAVAFPLAVFALAPFALTPRWKGESPAGALSLVYAESWVLLPLVAWGAAAFWSRHVLGRARRATWARTGLLAGASVALLQATLLAIDGVLRGVAWRTLHSLWWAALAPVLVAVWYGLAWWRSRDRVRGPLRDVGVVAAILATLAFALAHFARRAHERLPDERPECWVATAAARGHAPIVRPLLGVRRNGGWVVVNRQMLTLWRFEDWWRARAPASHAHARRLYDRIGPPVARRLTAPLAADLAHVALKPLEWIARLITR